MSTFSRVFVIIQLCFVFWFLLARFMSPWTGEYFERHSLRKLYEYVIESEGNSVVSESELAAIRSDYDDLMEYGGRSASEHMVRGWRSLFYLSSPYALTWAAAALVLCFALLYGKAGANHAAWVLPGLALLFAWDCLYFEGGVRHPDEGLYPTESYLAMTYANEPAFDGSISEQREQLSAALERYFAVEWAGAPASVQGEDLSEAAREGQYLFQKARLDLWREVDTGDLAPLQDQRGDQSTIWLLAYIFWSLGFAAAVQPRFLRATA